MSELLGRNDLENFYERPGESPDMIGFSLKKNLTPESTQVESYTISVVSHCVLCSFQSHQ